MVRSINEIGHVMLKKLLQSLLKTKLYWKYLKDIGVNFAQVYGITRLQPLDNFSFDVDRNAAVISHE